MAISNARIIVLVSSEPAASIYIAVLDGICTTAAPSLAWSLMSEPSVHIHVSGVNFGVHHSGAGRVLPVGCPRWVVGFRVGIALVSLRSESGCEKVYVEGPG